MMSAILVKNAVTVNVVIVETAVTAQHVAAIQTMCVVQIQVLIAANLVKLVAKGHVVTQTIPAVTVLVVTLRPRNAATT
jgi:hypothetical protein